MSSTASEIATENAEIAAEIDGGAAGAGEDNEQAARAAMLFPDSDSDEDEEEEKEDVKDKKAIRTCGTPGCTFVDFHDGLHSFDTYSGKRRCKRINTCGNNSKRAKQRSTSPDSVASVASVVSAEALSDTSTIPSPVEQEAPDAVASVASAVSAEAPSNTSTISSPFEQEASDADVYDSCAKNITRMAFATYCVTAAQTAERKDILYLESPHGGATKELLKHFPPCQLFPCNKSASATDALKQMFPEVNVVKGNVYKVYKSRKWLGVWFDTEETWQHNHQEGQPWRLDHVPSFDRAHVIATTLTIGTGPNPVKGGAEALCTELSQLIQDKRGVMDMLPFPYDGKSGRMNMVFGVAKFNPDPPWTLQDYNYARLKIPVSALGTFEERELYMVSEGHYLATAVVKDDALYAVYMSTDGHFFSDIDPADKISVEQAEKWRQRM